MTITRAAAAGDGGAARRRARGTRPRGRRPRPPLKALSPGIGRAAWRR
ncbi:MAG: hypothetical protein MZV64_42415 [Ignavibacteriales bacterium]|nr:hypothetical protein [Ignavibacteriales bacterium]